jgi:hypothetical protein
MSQTPLDRFAALELVLHAVARSASPFRVSEIVNDGFNKRVSSRIHLSLRQVRAASEALPQKAPQPAWLGGRYGNTRRHHTFQKELPSSGVKLDLSVTNVSSFTCTCAYPERVLFNRGHVLVAIFLDF